MANQMSMSAFLKKYYKQLHFDSMAPGVRARFAEWIKNDTLTPDMRLWVNNCLQLDANKKPLKDANGNYIPNPLPNIDNDLTDEELRKLFLAFQNAFTGMDADKGSFKDSNPDAYLFVTQYFGDNKLFKIAPANPECEQGIKSIIKAITDNEALKTYLSGGDKSIFKKEDDLNKFIAECNSKKYNTDASLQRTVQKVARALQSIYWDSNIPENVVEAVNQSIPTDKLKAVTNENAFAMQAGQINQDDLNKFKIYAKKAYSKNDSNEVNKMGLLQALYFNKNIRSKFAEYDNKAITGPINSAESSVNYQDKSKGNYVDEKLTDKKSPLERVKDWVGDTYNDVFKKYEELRGGRLFFKQEAKDIFKAIDSVKIKPADGLQTLLSKSKEIEGKIINPVSQQHFKWFTETMEPIAKKMPSAVAGAWKNAKLMKAVIGEIILKATDNNAGKDAIEKAKTAMEIMTAMKYGLMTSRIMDAMKQTNFTIFSDGGLSWNKNEGIKFVTGAFDQSIKAAFLGAGYAVTIVRNKIMMSNMQFTNKNNRNNSELAKRFAEEARTAQDNLKSQNQSDLATVATRKQTLQNLNSGANPINAQTISNEKTRLAGFQTDMDNAKNIMKQNETNYKKYLAAQEIVNTNTTLQNEERRLATEMFNLRGKINKIDARLKNPNSDVYIDQKTNRAYPQPYVNAVVAQLMQEIQEYNNQVSQKQQEHTNVIAQRNGLQGQLATAQQTIAAGSAESVAYNEYQNAQIYFQTAQNNYDTLNNRVTQFATATKELEDLNKYIAERNDTLSHLSQSNLNKVKELEDYWNYLQTGDTKTFGLSLKRAQKRFDVKKNAWLNAYVNKHGLSAA